MQPSGDNATHTELSRQVVHMLVGLLALLLRWLSWPAALGLALALIFFNLFLLPRLPGSRRFLYRPDEPERGLSSGIFLYPVSVFALILAFPVPLAAAMWGVLSFGDGMAGAAGSCGATRRLPWNRHKSFEGLLAFVLAAWPASAFLYWWTLPNVSSSALWWRLTDAPRVFASPGVGAIAIISLVTAVVCGVLETLDIGIDDNLLAPLGGACVMSALVITCCG